MTDDFDLYQGTDLIPYIVITDGSGNPVDLTPGRGFEGGWSAATWTAKNVLTGTLTNVKHKSDTQSGSTIASLPAGSPYLTIGIDPTITPTPTIQNCVFIYLNDADTGALTIPEGKSLQFWHELSITTTSPAYRYVVYPALGTKATFSVYQSDTWNPITEAPRLERIDATVPLEKARQEMPPVKIKITTEELKKARSHSTRGKEK